jgi:PAS domain S-box-containing protein
MANFEPTNPMGSMLKECMPTFYSKITNLKIGPKFIAAICAILAVLTVLDITYNAKKEQHITYESAKNWTNMVAETVRISLNTLMRDNKMDLRFKLFDSLSEELTELDDVRVIRSERTNEIFLEVNQKEIIPQLQGNKETIIKEINELNANLSQAIEEDKKDSIKEKIQYLNDDIKLIDDEIAEAGVLKPIDPREAEETGCHTYAKEGDVLGAISIEFSLEKINKEIRYNNLMMAAFWVMRFIVFLIVITFLLSFIITRNLKSMLNVFTRLSGGDLAVRAPVRSNDEIGQLAIGFNNMAETLDNTTVSKDYVDNIIRNMMDILVIISPDGKIIRLNSPTCALLGFTEGELIDQPIETIFTIHKSASDLLFETGSVGNLEGTFFSKDNKVVPVIYSASLMYGSNGEIDGIICVAKDITEKKESIEKLQQLTQYDGLTGLLNRSRPEWRAIDY